MRPAQSIVLIITIATVASISPAWDSYGPLLTNADPVWNQGKAEWAVYDAQRVIYGKPRHYEATIFTNKQLMDPATGVKTDDPNTPGAFAVFKHNVSEVIPTENYQYRFLTTCFVHSGTMEPYKIVCSSQEDCGSSYKQFIINDGRVEARQFSYFPGEGESSESYAAPQHLAFHEALTLTLRNVTFLPEMDAAYLECEQIEMIPDQTSNRATALKSTPAQVRFEGIQTIIVPYGSVETYHIAVLHEPDGGAERSEYWFAKDAQLQHVLVKYAGPYGVKYELKKLGWWAYWKDPKPQ